jgi:hypothetical protein
MGSLFSLGSPNVDIHMVKTRLGTGVQHVQPGVQAGGLHVGRESEEKKAKAASRAWPVSETWVGNNEEQLLELEGEESEGSVRALEDDSDDEPQDHTAFLNLANFPVPDEPSSGEEGGGGEEGKEESEEGSEEGGEEESEDSEKDVPLAQRKRKVARV